MPIDFFENKCKSTSNKIEFGLCDDPPPAENPAYIDENDVSKWIGIVKNNTNKVKQIYKIIIPVSLKGLSPQGVPVIS